MENKVKSISLIDKLILTPVIAELEKIGDFKVLVTPDHATPLSLRTHTNDPIPFFIYDSRKKENGVKGFCEKTAKETGFYIENGFTIMSEFAAE